MFLNNNNMTKKLGDLDFMGFSKYLNLLEILFLMMVKNDFCHSCQQEKAQKIYNQKLYL